MLDFTDQDRLLLRRACELAAGVRRPPKKLGSRVEPVWAAILGQDGKEVASATFCSGDTEDAVKQLLFGAVPEGCDLILTLEPTAGFARLPPVTESIRQLGVKRVVIGSLDPAQRLQGEGVATLQRMGIDVVLANGEEARLAQQLIDDYRLWLSRGLAVLRARVSLQAFSAETVDLSLESEGEFTGGEADAVLCVAGETVNTGDSWKVVLDPMGWERPSDRKILYQSEESHMVPGARKLNFRDGAPDLGALLRDLATLGILSVDLCGDAGLFRQALSSGLVAGVRARFMDSSEGLRMLSRVDRVRLLEGGDPVEIKLDGARLTDKQSRHLEARVELC